MASTSTLSYRWDVYVSFRGMDTRYRFTDHLYDALARNGIQPFMDVNELSTGDLIPDRLYKAIQQSNTYVVVFSENYASSRWCLDELVEILECCKTMGRLLLPVFYNIDPSVVRRQTGRFGQAFEKHRTRFEEAKLIKWRDTLTEVAALSGFVVDKGRSEADIIEKIVKRIPIKIYPLTSDASKYLVGMVSRVKDLTKLLHSTATQGVTRIGIYGMGGVGKTTLAKFLYNQNFHHFQGSCFLARVGEVSGHPYGRERLQEQLIADVLKVKEYSVDSVDQGNELIRDKIGSLKVLIVIDDIKYQNQYESLNGPFASGSVIVITTRDENLLDTIEVDLRYKVNELDDAESLELFSRYAFGNTKPSDKLLELSKKVVHHIGKIPLDLVVLGKFFSKHTEVEWEHWFVKVLLQKRHSLSQKLEIVFNDLESDDLKNIFLDLACFFTGNGREDVVKILKTCYRYVDDHINTLIDRCLITINDENELEMHDLLRDVGRINYQSDSPLQEPTTFSRLCRLDNIRNVLRTNVIHMVPDGRSYGGIEAITGIIPDGRSYGGAFSTEPLATSIFKRMRKLRYLYLEDVAIAGSFEETFADLRWLHWSKCPLQKLPCDFYPQRLVILEMPHSGINTWDLTMVLEDLTALDLSHSRDLTATPDFTRLPSLETLDLRSCVSLVKIDESVGSLSKLVSLDLNNCENLTSLPDTFGNLGRLKSLDIRGCQSLKALPVGLKSIKSLKEFKACGHVISELPNSEGDLAKLVNLFRRR